MNSLNVKAGTFNKYYNNISGILKALGFNNYFANIKRKNEEQDVSTKSPFTDEEIKLIFDNFTGDWLEISKIATYTGLRFSDVIHLNKKNISLDYQGQGHIITLTPSKTSHTGRSLYIQLIDELNFLLNKKLIITASFLVIK